MRRQKRFFIALILFFAAGASLLYSRPAGDRPVQSAEPAESRELPAPPPEIRTPLAVLPESPRPGDPLTVGYHVSGEAEDGGLRVSLINSQGRRLSRSSFFDAPGDVGGPKLKAAILAVPSTAASGAALVRVENAAGETVAEIPLVIADRNFAAEEIPLNQANTSLRTVPDPRKTAESEYLTAILYRTGNDIHTMGPFVPPVGSARRTSFFGDRRVYRYADGSSATSIHAGIDYGVPTGTAVSACAGGRVVLARPRIVTGNSVVLEHLPGVYSIYYHLDKILVEEGALINAGAVLGESGSTGLATGPHLHWEIRVSGENADPDAFTARPILDKEALLRKMGEQGLETEVSR
ncbi:MAG: M23 family metallopeptidase [Treponema sp.]|jgi:murein DD-endopeptidase MepM/ murein hydrolase activator NlpD|nr:M23 family metallopeptidase [Treponema sp.]